MLKKSRFQYRAATLISSSHSRISALFDAAPKYFVFNIEQPSPLLFKKKQLSAFLTKLTSSPPRDKWLPESAVRPRTQQDKRILDALRVSFAFEYNGEFTDAVTKFSVSDISKHDDSETVILARPAFANEDGFTAAEKGTAVHCFLQFADFEALQTDFESEKQRLIDRGHITPKQSKAVKEEDIRAFLDSEIYENIKSAEKVIRERKFMVSLDDLDLDPSYRKLWEGTDGMLSGIMDMLIEKKDSVILVDYKTDKIDSLSAIAKRYEMQLLLYKKALEIIQDKPVEGTYIYSFHNKSDIKLSI